MIISYTDGYGKAQTKVCCCQLLGRANHSPAITISSAVLINLYQCQVMWCMRILSLSLHTYLLCLFKNSYKKVLKTKIHALSSLTHIIIFLRTPTISSCPSNEYQLLSSWLAGWLAGCLSLATVCIFKLLCSISVYWFPLLTTLFLYPYICVCFMFH